MLAYASDRVGRGDLDIWIQPLAGGTPRRLTDDDADEYDPTFSPGGAWIAFRSDADAGGVYTMPSTGGQPHLIAAGGHHPRYSPDGTWIAYSAGTTRLHPSTPGSSHMFMVPAHGGTPIQVQPKFLSAFHPIWSPDGKHLLFLGRPDNSRPPREELDWWVAPIEGGAAIKTGARAMFAKLGLAPPDWPRVPLTPSDWSGEYLLFSRRSKDSVNVWKAPISLSTFRIGNQPERLTFGSGSEVHATLTPSGDVILADVRQDFEIWSLPIDANRAQVTGPLQRITYNAALDDWPSISRDGKKLMYVSYSTGASEIWLKDFETGQHTALTRDGAGKNWPEIAPDGSSYYFTRADRVAAVWWAKLHDSPRQLCTDCQTLTPLSGGGFLHSNLSPPIHSYLMDSNGRSRPWLWHSAWNLQQPQASPDERWVVFYASIAPQRTRIYVTQFRKREPPPAQEWIPITGDQFLETAPLWSPDGNRVYFGSNRDDFQCIWSVPLDPESKRPVGPPVPVAHFHTAAQPMGNVGLTRRGMSVAVDKIVFTLAQRSGNLWRLASPKSLNQRR
jgi:Tol biopolymer transport system component